jgi:hypothetical protein
MYDIEGLDDDDDEEEEDGNCYWPRNVKCQVLPLNTCYLRLRVTCGKYSQVRKLPVWRGSGYQAIFRWKFKSVR